MAGRGKNLLGRAGEDAVCKYLIDRGHTIMERNWRTGHLEVDIISLARDGIHFVEVKSRTAPVMGSPQDAVTTLKMRHIATAAGRYMAMRGNRTGGDMEVKFDVAAVTFEGGSVSIRYFADAYIPMFA